MAIATSMKVVRIEGFGGPDVMREQIVEVPVPADAEVLVKIDAAGVNPVDYKIRNGKYPAVKQDQLPYVLGRDVSGAVVQCGPFVQRFAKGDALFGMPGIDRGAYAEYVLLKESEAALRPRSLDSVAAGGVPLAALTAWQGLFRHGGVQEGQRVLIHGGSGGVGHFAVQFAKAKGAHVATTVSGRHAEFARKLGADQVIDYKKERFEDVVEDVDMVFDLIGGETQERSWNVLKKGGVLVSTLTQPSQEKAAERGARDLRYTVEESGADLSGIARLIESGRVKPVIVKTFPLEQAAEAQRFLEEEHPAGKVVLTVN
jgi:NADPH:quinone reductase-like Zn-dependent oxidoreductase